jgi:hypothetical protein
MATLVQDAEIVAMIAMIRDAGWRNHGCITVGREMYDMEM